MISVGARKRSQRHSDVLRTPLALRLESGGHLPSGGLAVDPRALDLGCVGGEDCDEGVVIESDSVGAQSDL